jgi:hypothetical protein
MDKKFLSAEDAIQQFGLDAAEFQQLVDAGELRALADRGTWKYRRDEIESLIQKGALKGKRPAEASPLIGAGTGDLTFLELDEDALAAGATQAESPLSAKDATPTELLPDDVQPARGPLADSVSDVRMVNEPTEAFSAGVPSQEPVSESAIPTLEGPVLSDSNELAVAESLSELDIVLPSQSSKFDQSSVIVGSGDAIPASDSDVKVVSQTPAQGSSILASSGDSVAIGEDSGISLSTEGSALGRSDSDVKIADSGLALERSDSGISLERSDSGLSLESSVLAAGDSALAKEDSGISLGPGDSGLTLEAMADSGISLEAQDSGIRLDEKTGRPRRPARPSGTEVEIPELESREFQVPTLGESSADQTAMVISDVEEPEAAGAAPPAKSKKGPGLSGVVEQDVEDLEIAEDLDVAEIDEAEAVEEVHEASDEVFATEESAEISGVLSEDSVSAVSAPSAVRAGVVEPPWGMAAVIPIAVCALLLLLNGLILWEGVSTMWTGGAPTLTGALVDPLGSLF